MTNRIEQLETIQNEAKELFRKKNTDYGDAFATYGSIGVLVRIGDKIQRLQSINSRGITLVDDEKLRDTLIDLHNYSAMSIMLLDENRNIKKTNETNEKKSSIKVWNITGDSGNKYIRETYVDDIGETVNTCSCPSFIYCKKSHKTCKHIDNEKNNNETNDKRWYINGDNNTQYIRETYVDDNGKTINTCSCPSYIYCNKVTKICKHIKRKN